jgi:hypothetical protein
MQVKSWGWLGLVALGAGCTGGEDEDGGAVPANVPVQQEARLARFESCPALESYLEDTAVGLMRAELERAKGYYREGNGGWFPGPMPVEDGGGSAPPGGPVAGGPGTSGPKDHTDTNNQVEGVDEADFVKNDGTRIFVLSGQKLYVHRSWPAEALSAVSSLQVEGWPREMFLEGSRVVVFSAVYTPRPEMRGGMGQQYGEVDCASDAYCGYYAPNTTKVTTVDVSDLAAPQVLSEVYLPGSYHNARKVQSQVRMVLRDDFQWPTGMRWWPELSPWDSWNKGWVEKEVDRLKGENEKLIRAQPLERWLPQGWLKQADGTRVALGYNCGDFHFANAPSALGITTVASIDLNASVAQAPGRTSLVAEPGEVYASAESLYVASPHWWWWPEAGQTDHTYLHKFDIRQPDRATYVGSGAVEGSLLDQFSMDEHEGVLRVATTVTRRVDDPNQPWRVETTNRISTLVQEGQQLKVHGQSEELARGERIFSARFLGKKGYVVTFRQVDPLFTFDLSDPAHPRKVGELKVPGFSSYIHPLGENHLLTVGMHIPEDGNWQQRALKLSIFDVTNPAQPTEKFTQLVGTAYGWSEALSEHKAFNYFAARGLLAIPFTDWTKPPYPYTEDYWNGFISELRVFRVDTTLGFSPVGAVSMRDMYQRINSPNWSYAWSPSVRRSIMADDYVYAISDAGVRVAHVSNLSTPLATSQFSPLFYP